MRNLNRPGIWLGTIAVALAMGGTATAASMVTSAQIKDGTITAKDIKRGSIGTAQLSSSAKDGTQGVSGPMGPIGPAGPMGPAGPSTAGKIVIINASKAVPAGKVDSVTAVCPPGHRIVSGGFTLIGGDVWSSKTYDSVSWTVGSSGYDWSIATTVEAHAHCAPAGIAVAASASAQAKARNAEIERDETAFRKLRR